MTFYTLVEKGDLWWVFVVSLWFVRGDFAVLGITAQLSSHWFAFQDGFISHEEFRGPKHDEL